MKLSLFVFLFALTSSAQTGRLGPDFLKGLETDPVVEKHLRDEAISAQRQRDTDRAQATAYARDAQRIADLALATERQEPVRLAVRAQAAVTAQPTSHPDCPGYKVFRFDQAAPVYGEHKFMGPNGSGNPVVTAVDYRSSVPNATHEINPTVVIQANSGWSVQDVTDSIEKVSKIYAQCGIRIGRMSVIHATLPYSISVIDEMTEHYTAHRMPEGAPKPWLFFVNHRADNPGQDGGGKSMAYTSDSSRDNVIKGSAWMAHDSLYSANGKRNGYTPELVIGHELAHLMTDGDHQSGAPNILADNGNNIVGKITPQECAQMKANSSLIHRTN
jgi:hypothetical protein